MSMEFAEFIMSIRGDVISFLITVCIGGLVYLICETLKVCKNNKEIEDDNR